MQLVLFRTGVMMALVIQTLTWQNDASQVWFICNVQAYVKTLPDVLSGKVILPLASLL